MRSHHDVTRAVAMRLVDRLDTYEIQMELLAETWPDPALCASTAALLDVMKAEAALVPDINQAWVDLLVSHYDVMQQFRREETLPMRLDVLERHVAPILELQARCLAVADASLGSQGIVSWRRG